MNRFREDREEEEVGHDPVLKPAPKKAKTAEEKMETSAFLSKFFHDGIITKEAATNALPFLCFLACLGMIYIGNSHFAVNNVTLHS